MDKDYLTLKRASASRPSGEWSDDDYDVLCEGAVVGRIFKSAAAPVGAPWFWPIATSKTARRHTAMSRRVRLRWQRSPRAGDGNSPAPPFAWPLVRSERSGHTACKELAPELAPDRSALGRTRQHRGSQHLRKKPMKMHVSAQDETKQNGK
jgi:hypothetical protein